jgi:hypothetical protein
MFWRGTTFVSAVFDSFCQNRHVIRKYVNSSCPLQSSWILFWYAIMRIYKSPWVRHGLGQAYVRFVVKLTITRVFNNNDTKSVVIVHIVRHIQRPAGDVTIIYTISCAYFIYYYCRTSTSVIFVLQVVLYWCILVFIPMRNLNSCLLRRSCRKRKPLRTYIQ